MRPIAYGCCGQFWESLATPTANFPDILMDFCSDRPRYMRTKFEVRTFTRSWDNSCDCDCSDWVGVAKHNLQEEKVEKALMSSYRHFIVIFPLSLHVSEIGYAAFVLLHTTFPSDSRLVSSNFPHIPAEAGRFPLRYEERRCWANVRAINFQDLQPMWSWSTNVTDGRTNAHMHGRTTCDCKTSLCSIVRRALKRRQNTQNTGIANIIGIADNVSLKYRHIID